MRQMWNKCIPNEGVGKDESENSWERNGDDINKLLQEERYNKQK